MDIKSTYTVFVLIYICICANLVIPNRSGLGMEWGIEGLKHYTNSRSLWVWKKVFE